MEKCSRTEHREARTQPGEEERALLTVASGFTFYSVGMEEETNENFDLGKKVKRPTYPKCISFLGLKAAVPRLTYKAQTPLPKAGTETLKKGYLASIDELSEVTDDTVKSGQLPAK